MVSNTNDTNTTTETPTAMGRLLDVSPLGGEIVDHGDIPITIAPAHDKWGGDAATLTIGEGPTARTVTIDAMAMLQVTEALTRLTNDMVDRARFRLTAEARARLTAGE